MNIKVITILPHGRSIKTSKTETDQQVVSSSTPLDGKHFGFVVLFISTALCYIT